MSAYLTQTFLSQPSLQIVHKHERATHHKIARVADVLLRQGKATAC